jgi:high-affinity nickel permease
MSLTFDSQAVSNIFLAVIALSSLVILFILYRMYREKG